MLKELSQTILSQDSSLDLKIVHNLIYGISVGIYLTKQKTLPKTKTPLELLEAVHSFPLDIYHLDEQTKVLIPTYGKQVFNTLIKHKTDKTFWQQHEDFFMHCF